MTDDISDTIRAIQKHSCERRSDRRYFKGIMATLAGFAVLLGAGTIADHYAREQPEVQEVLSSIARDDMQKVRFSHIDDVQAGIMDAYGRYKADVIDGKATEFPNDANTAIALGKKYSLSPDIIGRIPEVYRCFASIDFSIRTDRMHYRNLNLYDPLSALEGGGPIDPNKNAEESVELLANLKKKYDGDIKAALVDFYTISVCKVSYRIQPKSLTEFERLKKYILDMANSTIHGFSASSDGGIWPKWLTEADESWNENYGSIIDQRLTGFLASRQ